MNYVGRGVSAVELCWFSMSLLCSVAVMLFWQRGMWRVSCGKLLVLMAYEVINLWLKCDQLCFYCCVAELCALGPNVINSQLFAFMQKLCNASRRTSMHFQIQWIESSFSSSLLRFWLRRCLLDNYYLEISLHRAKFTTRTSCAYYAFVLSGHAQTW